MNATRLAAAVLLAVLLASPALAQDQAAVTGTVIYLERILLPPTARVIVQLQDVSRADAAATVLAEQVIDTAGAGPPYAFSLSYDPAQIQDNLTYAVRAEIRDGDQLLFSTAESYQVITRGNPTSDVEIRVVGVGGGNGGATTAPAPVTPAPTTLPATGRAGDNALAVLLLAVAALAGGLGARRLAR
ncbi:MAG TPA: YbaY family lipoprotein [Chloroflexaceae bacterium]|nr:YbaY family lipoprotein [Chloroflexaceae bacterium]